MKSPYYATLHPEVRFQKEPEHVFMQMGINQVQVI